MKTAIKKSGVAILLSDSVNFRAKKVTSKKEVHYIMIK